MNSIITGIIKESSSITAQSLMETISEARDVLKGERKSGAQADCIIKEDLIWADPNGSFLVVGDLHGDIDSLKEVLKKALSTHHGISSTQKIVFMGDYGDRGPYSIEIYYILLKLKTLYPDSIIMMRGNHEAPIELSFSPYDLPNQTLKLFGTDAQNVRISLEGLFNYFYLAMIVSDKYVFIHGGVPSMAADIDDLVFARKKHPTASHFEEMLWNDPREDFNGIGKSARGYGRVFGEDVTSNFLNFVGARVLIRGHEPCDGVKVNHGGKVLTIFSSKGQYNNSKAGFVPIDLQESTLSGWNLAESAVLF
ncbi:MAG: metallophosphoesterase [Thaumarchaeota archaeon]|nr:metallophosphoesterase [Nitrososphaerota archaeon]